MRKGVKEHMEAIPALSRSEVQLLYHWGYYDGPLSGVCRWRGERYWFTCVDMGDDEREARTFHMFEFTEEEWAREDERHALFRECVGTHTDYDQETGRRNLDGVRPEAGWHRYYDRHPPRAAGERPNVKKRKPVAAFRE